MFCDLLLSLVVIGVFCGVVGFLFARFVFVMLMFVGFFGCGKLFKFLRLCNRGLGGCVWTRRISELLIC